jgi:hypothetical protein
MKKLVVIVILLSSTALTVAQNNSDLIKHYEAYYTQMKKQGDVQGIINAMTHLNLLSPSKERLDTLAYVYMSDGKYLQALNTIGIEHDTSDSDIAVEVKAVSLKALSEIERATVQFEELYKRDQNPYLAYELAELSLQLEKLEDAKKYINYGIANVKDDAKKGFYESQQPYQVPLKAAFYYLKGLLSFNENKAENIDTAVNFMNQALQIAPNFNLAKISKEALISQKQAGAEATKN